MDWREEAFVLSARSLGETGAVVRVLTAGRGLWAAHVAGGASRRLKPILQPGARVAVDYRSRTSEQLGSARLEPVGPGVAEFFDDPTALLGLSAAAALVEAALPEREPHPAAFAAFEALSGALAHEGVWPAVYVRFEMGLLDELGFGLDLSECAVTGAVEDLVYVSPRSGRAVSAAAGAPYAERLLRLPPFLARSSAGLRPGDVADGLALTGRFLERRVFDPMNRPLPPARVWLAERLLAAGLA